MKKCHECNKEIEDGVQTPDVCSECAPKILWHDQYLTKHKEDK